VLSLRCENEARVFCEARVLHVIVMVDPSSQARSQPVDEGLGQLFEAAARSFRRERNIEHYDAALQISGLRQFSRGSEGELGSQVSLL
jgi:hypothetical protein